MSISRGVFSVIAGVTLAASAVLADTYDLDPVHTTIGFGVRHMVVSTVHGKFAKFTGTIEAGADGVPTKAAAKMDTASVTTDNADRDKHLRSPDFFDAEKYPAVTFESTKIVKAGDGVQVTGNLSIHGVTKEITIPMTVSGPVNDPWGNTRIGLEGSAKINRKDFGMVWNKALDGGGVVVSDDVKLDLSLEAIKQKAK